MIDSRRVLTTHKQTVQSILDGEQMIPVNSGGDTFYCVAHYPYRQLASRLPFQASDLDAAALAAEINCQHVDPSINIASGAENLSREGFMALVGGGYHEAAHRLYTYQGQISPAQIRKVCKGRLGSVNWQSRRELLMSWTNIVEDIRIERRLCREFPGALPRMESLQDFILSKEGDDPQRGANPMSMIACIFRDLGFGPYKTQAQKKRLKFYKRVCPPAWELVTNGALAPLLEEAKNSADDDHAAMLRIAMDVIIILNALAPTPPDDEQGEGDGDEGGDEGNAGNGDPNDESGDESEGNSEGNSEGESEGNSEGESDDESDDESEGESEDEADGESEGNSEGDETGDESDSKRGHSFPDKEPFSQSLADLDLEGMHDNSSALTDDLDQQIQNKCQDDEQPWRPLTTMNDQVVVAPPGESKTVKKLEKRAKEVTKALTTKLRQKFRGIENTGVSYGRRGKRLSGRHLTQTVSEIRSDRHPTRPFRLQGQTMDTSIAVDIVLDQSGSMINEIADVSAGLISIASAMATIGAKTSIHGFQSGLRNRGYDWDQGLKCHRRRAVKHWVYKTFRENFTTAVKSRLGSIEVGGGTPLCDGIQFGLDNLSSRKEAHRILFVLTDGDPSEGTGVIRRQNRLAAEAGIHVIAVSIGGYHGVKYHFDNYVVTYNLEGLAPALIGKIDEVVTAMGSGSRGKRVGK